MTNSKQIYWLKSLKNQKKVSSSKHIIDISDYANDKDRYFRKLLGDKIKVYLSQIRIKSDDVCI